MLALRDLRTLPWQVCEGREALMGELSPGRCDFHLPPPPQHIYPDQFARYNPTVRLILTAPRLCLGVRFAEQGGCWPRLPGACL